METKTINIFTFDELTEEAKEKAIEKFRSNDDYFWDDDNRKVLDEFEKNFPVNIGTWEYGYHKYINFTMESFENDEQVLEFTGQRLATWLWNNYKDVLYKGKYYSKGNYTYVNPENVNDYKYEYKQRYSRVLLEENCLTGYCVGYDILKPLHDFIKKPNNSDTFESLLNDCLESWLDSCHKDYEYSQSDEAITETIEANEYYFDEEGELQ